MPLDAQSQAVVDALNRARAGSGGKMQLSDFRRPPPPASPATLALVTRVENRTVAGPGGPIPVRFYWPDEGPPTGITVYFHGGGFIMGGQDHVDGVCRVLTQGSGSLVMSVAYRLAPEHKFPAGVEDAYAVVQWAIANAGDLGCIGGRVAVAGDSAGGTLATVACMMARDRGTPTPHFQLLIYPGINLRLDTPERTALAGMGYLLTNEAIKWLNGFYCTKDEDFLNPYCAPAYATDLTGLPPALVIAGEYDPLRFENKTYADSLEAAGVPTTYLEYPGTIHGFVGAFEAIDVGREALAECAAALRAALRPRDAG